MRGDWLSWHMGLASMLVYVRVPVGWRRCARGREARREGQRAAGPGDRPARHRRLFDISEWTGDRRARGVIFEMPIPISLQASRFRPRRTIRHPLSGDRTPEWTGRSFYLSISTRQVRAATQKLTIELNCHGVK